MQGLPITGTPRERIIERLSWGLRQPFTDSTSSSEPERAGSTTLEVGIGLSVGFRGAAAAWRGLAPGSIWAALVLLLFGLGGCQPSAPPGNGDGDDCTPGQPCGGGVEDPGDNDNDDPGDGPPVGTTDSCSGAAEISGELSYSFDNSAATMDGPAHAACTATGQDEIDLDLWLCWTAECSSLAVIETCGRTELDTRLAVYRGCECPTTDARLLDCSDDDCAVQSRVTFEAVAGQEYLIRVGAYPGTDGGTGQVSVSCGFDGCPGTGGCTTNHGGRGCEDESCCNEVCAVDAVCCSIAWDEVCAEEASAFCNGGFDSCESSNGACTAAKTTPGCDDADCCNAVCRIDTYCCMEEWDAECVSIEARTCFGTCLPSTGSCTEAHSGAGCDDPACCAEVCPREPSCCSAAWTPTCAGLAVEHCEP